jgi:murein DD-endopeptidase MepM/ murein hydrolase activator NlpD
MSLFKRLPVDAPYDVTTEFGLIKDYPLNNGFHKGMDFVTKNRRVYLVADANIVVKINNGNDGNGIYCKVGDFSVAYCHMENFAVQSGFYKAGTYLGLMGKTGFANGIHLHFVIRRGTNEYINPRELLPMIPRASKPEIRILCYSILGMDGKGVGGKRLDALQSTPEVNKIIDSIYDQGKTTSDLLIEFHNSSQGKRFRDRELTQIYEMATRYANIRGVVTKPL